LFTRLELLAFASGLEPWELRAYLSLEVDRRRETRRVRSEVLLQRIEDVAREVAGAGDV
jgi:hypothetical protein